MSDAEATHVCQNCGYRIPAFHMNKLEEMLMTACPQCGYQLMSQEDLQAFHVLDREVERQSRRFGNAYRITSMILPSRLAARLAAWWVGVNIQMENQ